MTVTNLLLNAEIQTVKTDLVAKFLYGAVGDDNTTPDATDTALGNEVFRSAIDDVDTASVTDAVTFSLIIGSAEANSNTMREHGWFDAASSGNLWIHVLLNAINKTSDVQLFLDTTITIDVEEV